MADSSDFNPDALRRAITTGLVNGPIITDPPSGEKDVGYAVEDPVDPGDHNSLFRHNYVMGRWLEEDALPGLAQWGGLLGTEAAGAGLVTDSATDHAVNVAAGRYRLGGGTYTVAAATALNVGISGLGPGTLKFDWIVVEVDVVARTASYAVVNGAVDREFTALAANQYPIAWTESGFGPLGADPTINDIRFRPGPPRARTETLVYGVADMRTVPLTASDYTIDDDEGSILMADGARALIPLHFPLGTRIDAIRMRGLKNAPSDATDGNVAVLRRQDIRTGQTPDQNQALATIGSDALGLSATPFNVSVALPVALADANIVIGGYKYNILVSHVNSATPLADRARVWAIELDVTYGLVP